MVRKAFLVLLATLTLISLHLAQAQQQTKVHRIGLLQSASQEVTFIDGFRRGLRELGYIENRNFTLEARAGEMKRERLSALADELLRLKPDIIVAGGGLRFAL